MTTAPFPGFPTDMQAQMMAVAAIADGTSVITDTIYLDRFSHVAELARLGANIELKGNVAVVKGVDAALGRAGDGDRPARERRAGAGRAGGRGRDAASRASTTSIAATRASTTS